MSKTKKRGGATEAEKWNGWEDLEVVAEPIQDTFNARIKVGQRFYLSQLAELMGCSTNAVKFQVKKMERMGQVEDCGYLRVKVRTGVRQVHAFQRIK